MDIGLVLDGSVGALVGALITGSAQIWSFRAGNKTARVDLSLGAARDLLEDVHFSISVLRLLPYTDNLAGSPLSYGERLRNAQPMRDRLAHALFATVPLLTDPKVGQVFTQFADYCTHVSGPTVGAQDIHRAVKEVIRYANFVHGCLSAHINKEPLPQPPTVDVPAFDRVIDLPNGAA